MHPLYMERILMADRFMSAPTIHPAIPMSGYIREPRYQKERSPTGSFVKSGFRHIEFSIRSGNRASFPNRKHIAGWQISSV